MSLYLLTYLIPLILFYVGMLAIFFFSVFSRSSRVDVCLSVFSIYLTLVPRLFSLLLLSYPLSHSFSTFSLVFPLLFFLALPYFLLSFPRSSRLFSQHDQTTAIFSLAFSLKSRQPSLFL
uniref:Uncharacterized protein n=1 Tax=Cacopsylla melanoneura TaxID=428564 RepID=A0A8D8V8A5_9HEMI